MNRALLTAIVVVTLILGRESTVAARHHRGPHGGGSHAPAGTSGPNECLVHIHDMNGPLPEGATLCQTATGHGCTFDLALCLNESEPGCTPADLSGLTFRATGHCGHSGQVRVEGSGTGSVWGAFTGVNVHTRSSKKAPGRCTIRAEVRSAKVHARTDVDTVTLVCMPQGTPCAGSTTTTTVAGTTTTTVAGTTTTSTSTTPSTTGTTASTTGTTATTTSATGSTASTSSTTGSATTSTTMATTFTKLAFTVSPGTTSCGPAGLTASGAAAPTSGQLFSDTGCSTAVATGQLGLGCLYFGGGNATNVPGGGIPDGSTSILNISGGTLSGASTGDPNTCTVAAGPGTHCINNNTMPACANDAGCGGAAGACALDANCFFGPPLPVLSPPPNGALTTCVLNVVQTDASGTTNTATGDSSLTMPLSSRAYITGNTTSPSPQC